VELSLAEQSAERATRSAERAEQVQDLLVGIFTEADPNRTKGAQLSAKELLDRGLERIRDDSGVAADLKADLLMVLAGVYKTYSENEAMETAAREAVRLRRLVLPGSAELAAATRQLASAIYRQGRMAEAESMHREAVELLRDLDPPRPLILAQALNSLAVTVHDQSRVEEAIALHRESLELRSAALGADDESVATSRGNLALELSDADRFDEAAHLFEEADRAFVATLGLENTKTTVNLRFLALNEMRRGRYAEADQALRTALDVQEKLLGPDAPLVAATLQAHAQLAKLNGDLELAEQQARRALGALRKTLGPHHINVGGNLIQLGGILSAAGRHREALDYIHEGIDLRTSIGTLDQSSASAWGEKARLERLLGNFEVAVTTSERALDLIAGAYGPRHRAVATALNERGLLERSRNDLDAADERHEEALAILLEVAASGDSNVASDIAWTATLLARNSLARGDAARALERLERALPVLEEDPENGAVRLGAALSAKALALERLGHTDEAAAVHRRAVDVLSSAPGGNEWSKAD
jgi:tetratricopeptide (TPR) repeat protein